MDPEEPTPRTPLLPAALDANPVAGAKPPSSNDATPLQIKMGRKFDIFDTVIPPLVMSYIGIAYYVACSRIAPSLSPSLRFPYLLAAHTLLPALLYTFLSVYLLPASSAAPPPAPPRAVLDRLVPYVCTDESGAVSRCWKDGCAGRWKPERARHCSICRSCKTGFDHHCPWFGTCISSTTYLKFLVFLLLVPLTVLTIGGPLVRPDLAHFKQVWTFALSQDSTVRRDWLNWRWSWVLGAGPVGRLMVAVVLGYWRWTGEVPPLAEGWLAVLLAIGFMVAFIAIGLAFSTLRSLVISLTPIEARILQAYNRTDPRLRTAYLAAPPSTSGKPLLVDPRVWLWVPAEEGGGKGRALRTRVEERPFGLGWKGNLRAMVKDGWRSWTLLPWSPPPPLTVSHRLRLNPTVYKRMKYEASLLTVDGKESTAESSDGEDDGSGSEADG